MSGRPINEDRKLAIALGDKTYTGSTHSRCGTTERYTSGGGCVHCARVVATEQREARKFLKQHEAEYRESLLNDVVEQAAEPLDSDEPMALEETNNAEARARQAVDDIM